MKNLVLIGFWIMMLLWLNSCAGTYKHIEVEYPPLSPYAKYKAISLEVVSPKDVNKEEMKSFKELIIKAFQKRGIVVADDKELSVLTIEIIKFNKDALNVFVRDIILGWPLNNKTTNFIDLRVSIKDKKGIIEFKEFQEFKESIRNWEDLKKAVANRIADAVYFAY